jgi:hypothetical protein
MTHYVQIVTDGVYHADGWFPWKNCRDDHEFTARLALGKFMRESGYARREAQFEPFNVTILVADDTTPKHKSGRFSGARRFEMKISKKGG